TKSRTFRRFQCSAAERPPARGRRRTRHGYERPCPPNGARRSGPDSWSPSRHDSVRTHREAELRVLQAPWLSLVFLPWVGRKTSACVRFRVEQTCDRGHSVHQARFATAAEE